MKNSIYLPVKPVKLLIFVVAFNAESTLVGVLSRIPKSITDNISLDTEILIIDDASTDNTFDKHSLYIHNSKILFLKNPVNLGYGGNQKLGYRYAIDNDFDIVALMHGDGQYAPEKLPDLLQPLLDNSADAVFGSRMLNLKDALNGGMPIYKFIGNIILTKIQNALIGTNLSEWHSGYRLYRTQSLKEIPFEYNSNYYDFDTDIIIQLHAVDKKIYEMPVPTFYGDEICHVNGISYALKILKSCLLFRIQSLGIFYQNKFDLEIDNNQYKPKFDFLSSHSMALAAVLPETKVLNLGSGPTELVEPFLKKNIELTVVDEFVSRELAESCAISYEESLDTFSFDKLDSDDNDTTYDVILALDVIEHLKNPERLLKNIRNSKKCISSKLILTTPNVVFLPLRIMFLLGYFNYGKRGILDRTHTRLFTFSSLKKILKDEGYKIIEIKGIPAPFPLALKNKHMSNVLLWCNNLLIKFAPTVFSYQIFVQAEICKTTEQLLSLTKEHTNKLIRFNVSE